MMKASDWTDEQIDFMKSMSGKKSQLEQYNAFQERYNRPDISRTAFRKKAWKLGIKSKYSFGGEGREPWNKGISYNSGVLPPIHSSPEFSTRTDEGAEYIKIGNDWIRRSIYEYEKQYGVRVDSSRVSIIHLDRDPHNFAKDNLYMLTRGELCVFNRYYKWSNNPKENLAIIGIVKNKCAIAKLKRKHKIFPYNEPSSCRSKEFENPIILEKIDDRSNEQN